MPDPYISEVKYLGGGAVDFVEVAVDAGTDVSNIQIVIYNPNGTVRTTNTLGTLDNTEAGRDIYVVDAATSATFNGLNRNGAVALVVDGTVTSFLSFDRVVTATSGPANGTSSTQIGTTGFNESLETSDNGGSYTVLSSPTPGNVPCFLAGTLIETAVGTRPIENLRAGDLIWTADDGLQPLIWAGKRMVSAAEQLHPGLAPICIPAGALGHGQPEQDLYVSPNHRIAVSHATSAVYFDAREALIAAKHMDGHRGAQYSAMAEPLCYHHLLFEKHQLICAGGAISESFHPGQIGLDGFTERDRRVITGLLAAQSRYGPTVRQVLKASEAALFMAATTDVPIALQPPSIAMHAA